MHALPTTLCICLALAALAGALFLGYHVRRFRNRCKELEQKYREKELEGKKTAQRLHSLEQALNLNLAPVCITDTAKKFVFGNKAFLRLAGVSEAQARGRALREFFSWEKSLDRHYCACIPHAARQQVHVVRYASPLRGGQSGTALLRMLDLQDTEQRTCGQVHLLWDVSECLRLDSALRESQKELEAKVLARTESLALANEELKSVIHQLENSLEERRTMQSALEENEKRFNLVLESANIGLWDWAPNSDKMVVNEIWAQLTGHTLQELEPVSIETWKNLCKQDDLDQTRILFQAHENGATQRYEQQFRLRHKEGHWVWVQACGKIVERDAQGVPLRVVGTAMDISKSMETRQLLLQSLSEFEAIFENSQVGVIYLRENRKIARVNAKFSELVGYESWELLGESFEILHGNRERFVAFGEQHYGQLQKDGIMHLEYELHRKDGKLLPCLLSGKAVDASDPGKGVIWIVEDLIQLQQAKTLLNRQSALLTALIDSIPDLIIYKDSDGVFMGCNKAFCEETQQNREEIIGVTDYDLLPLESALRVREKDRLVLESRKPDLIEENIRLTDSRVKEFESLRTPYYGPDNKLLGLIVLHRNISERRHSEKLKKDVELMVRHDLKTPLNVVITLPQLLLKNPNLEQKERERYLRTINKSGLLMLDLINRSLDIYKMESGSYTLAPVPFDLIALIAKVVEDCGLQAKNREVGIEFASKVQSCTVMGEELLYYTMLANIVKNAIEATPPESVVRITLQCGERITIECNNPGIVPEEIRGSFFDKYATQKKRGGSGLGTYSAKLIVQLHQGSINMRCSQTQGTTITIDLPAHPQGDPDKPQLY